MKKTTLLLLTLAAAFFVGNALADTGYIVNNSSKAQITTIHTLDGKLPTGFTLSKPLPIEPNTVVSFTESTLINTPVFIGDNNGNGCYFMFSLVDKSIYIDHGIPMGNTVSPGCTVSGNHMLGISIYSGRH